MKSKELRTIYLIDGSVIHMDENTKLSQVQDWRQWFFADEKVIRIDRLCLSYGIKYTKYIPIRSVLYLEYGE